MTPLGTSPNNTPRSRIDWLPPNGIPHQPSFWVEWLAPPRRAYLSMQVRFWWFEFVEMARKLLLVAVLQFVEPESGMQVAVGTLLSVIFVTIGFATSPMCDAFTNKLMILAHLQIFATLFSGLLLKVGRTFTPCFRCQRPFAPFHCAAMKTLPPLERIACCMCPSAIEVSNS